jgi:hypothetical protein
MTSTAFDADIGELTIARARKEIVFIEDNVADYQSIAANAGPGRQVVILDSGRDGLQQIADAVKGMSGIDALHVVTHGTEGKIGLGTLTLDQASAAQHTGLLQAIGSSLSASGDILFYGCSVGAGEGSGLITQLAIATGADVAASSNPTGDAHLGGDWNLEISSGSIETAPFVSPALAAQYHELLSITTPTTVTFDHAPHSTGIAGPGADIAYTIQAGYTLQFDGQNAPVWSYLFDYSSNAYLSFSPYSNEDRITIGFTGGQVFTPTSVKVNGNASVSQTLIFTGLRADGTEVMHANVPIAVGATIDDFVTQALGGFTNIKTLVITAQAGGTIQYFHMDDLVLANAGPADTTPPTLAITSDLSTVKAGATANITFTFSEDPGSSFVSGDVAVSGGTLGAISGSGVTRTAVFTPSAGVNGSVATISVAANQYADAAGNDNTASSSLTLTVDTVAPNAPSAPNLASGSDSGSSPTDDITNTNTGLVFSGSTEAGVTTVKLYDGTTEIGSTSAISGNAYTITTVGTLADGAHTIIAKAFDAAGNVSSASGGATITVDRTQPTVSISSSQSVLKVGESSIITFTFSEDPGASFSWSGSAGDVSVSGGTLSAISGAGLTRTATFTPNADVNSGSANVSVSTGSYADVAGNFGAGGTSATITYDTLAPNAPSAPDLAGGDDSGASSTDNLTNDATTSFSGTADAGTTVKLYDGATEIGSVTASGGTWTIPVAGLAEGSHTITARAFDAVGNASAASSGLAVTVDRTPPSTTVAGATLSADTGASSTDMITSADTQTISGTLSANLGADEQVMVSVDNGATWTAASASAGTNTWELAATFSGSDVLKVRVVDAAGNAGAAYSQAYILDKVAPAAPSTPDLDTASDNGSSHTDDVTGVTLPAFSGTAEVGATVRLFDGGIEIGSAVATDGTWHIATSSGTPLGQRTHTITAIATDLAGNSGTNSAALEVQVITAGPATTIKTMALSSDSGTSGDFITNASVQTVSGTLSAVLAAGERVQFSLDQGAHWTDAVSATGSDAWSFGATLTAGAHDIQVRVLDAVDNSGPVRVQAYTLDSVKPAVTITSDAAQLKAGETATISFTFSEDPGTSFSWDGGSGDLTVSGGTLSAISGTGPVRTAVFTPAAATNGGTASITVTGTYEDVAGNSGTAGATPSISFDTLAPGASSAPDLDSGSDKGSSDTDNLTNQTSLVFSGTAEPGSTVRLYDTNGSTEIGHGTAIGGTWTITTAALADGAHTITAKVFDGAGNVSATSGPITVTVDATKPGALAAPVLASASDSGVKGDGITSTAAPVFSGTAEALAQVTLYDGATAIGSVKADAAGTWQITAVSLPDGVHAITARQVDAAGNESAAGAAFSLSVDTVAPAAPAAPALKAASDTGTIGDGITENDLPVIEGTALANSVVTLYESAGLGNVKVGVALADGSGKWSVQTTGLGYGTHTLKASQQDAAGNESAASAAFSLRIEEPPAPANLIDGVAVSIQPISLPGGVIGSAVSIPMVGAIRTESSGVPGVADIPLATNGQGANLLLAQVAPGYGLSASGANVPVANAAELLIAAIKAATPSHAAADQGHLTGNGQSFLAGLASGGALLVETVKPVNAASAPNGVLTLSGPVPSAGQSAALVIDATGLDAGSTIALQQVNFAAVIGAANVVAGSSMVLSGDAASQHFTLAPGGSGAAFAGGGNDTLSVAPSSGPAPAGGTTLLHGGSASDVAAFSGARADYKLEFHNGYVLVSSKTAPAVKAMVINVEQLQFSDASVTVQNSTDMGTLAGIYQTVLGRQADVSGIEFWANGHQAGASWGAIALDIIRSSEHAASHEGFNGVAAHDVALLYTALFNRAPDAEGLAFWTSALAHGASLEQIATDFVQSVEMVGHQRAALDWDFIVG